ncbi:unnamed protein product [Nippostrongylus brasiliensis]|uniref:HTH_48 domain-containing protein n=1 Tax=Nippostrongylus brasiliensis TaxID=27835 RepID=A0A0N4Y4D0_NIPBR|nr:unnamed protein product [Nippostrongylus brasiliensis]
MVHSFGEGVVSMSTVHDWFKKFKAGHYEVEDKERSGRPSVLNNDELREQVEVPRGHSRRVHVKLLKQLAPLSFFLRGQLEKGIRKRRYISSRR